MDTSREDFGIAVRSAFLRKGTKQRFSLFVLSIASILLLFFDSMESKPINFVRSLVKDTIYRGSLIISSPINGFSYVSSEISTHFKLYSEYSELKENYTNLKNSVSKSEYLELENKKIISDMELIKKFPDEIFVPTNVSQQSLNLKFNSILTKLSKKVKKSIT